MVDISSELLVTTGLLPENLPPVYTSKQLWPALPHGSSFLNKTMVGEASSYNASKRGNQRRMFHIPHPLFVLGQGDFFKAHWNDVEAIFDKSTGSASRPILRNDSIRHVHFTPHSELPALRLKKLSKFKYCLITDVSRFYYSVYTHSLPWALHGKQQSKTDKKAESRVIFGNMLDLIVRQAQFGQTIGLPVGPDVSKLSAELLMSAVDERFLQLNKKVAYVRHVDDYWVGGHTFEQCEKHLQHLRSALRYFELDINESKTRIVSTKYVFGEAWPSEFEDEIKSELAKGEKGKPLAVLGKIIERATQDNDEGIVKRIIRTIDGNRLWDSDWGVLEHFLAQCAVQFPHSFDYVARVIAWRARTSRVLDKSLWIEIARTTTLQAASLGRDSEACWAIWLLKEMRNPLPKALTDLLVGNNGSLVLCFLAHFPKYKLASDKKLYEKLRDRLDGDLYSGPDWPISLELKHLGQDAGINWSVSKAHQNLRSMHDGNLSLIRWDAPPKVFEPTDAGDADDAPESAIEDFGSDYDEVDDTDEDNDVEDDFEQDIEMMEGFQRAMDAP